MNADQSTSSSKGETSWYMPHSLRLCRKANTVLSVVAGITFVLLRVVPSLLLVCILVVAVLGVLYVQSIKIAWRRRAPFCIHCGYDLQGLPDNHRCPECGEHYTLASCADYQRDPIDFQRRWEKKRYAETTQIVDDFLAQQRERRECGHKRE
jgi:tRNA(Ile2) C34 agmatinyltransferase TiaS